MQQPMVQFLANFGLYNLNIECREAVHIFHWLWNGRNFCMNLSQFELFFKEIDKYSLNGYQLVLLKLYSINTVMLGGFNLSIILNSLKNTNMLFFGYKIINIGDNHMKAAEFKGLSWLKQYTGHMCTWKTLPSFAHPDGTDICSGPWTKWAAFMWFVRDSALAGTAVIHCFNTLNNCSTSITNQPKFRPTSRFPKNFDQIVIFRKFRGKSSWSTISSKIEIFENFDQNRDFLNFWHWDYSKIFTKIEIFKNFDQNRDFRKFRPKSRFSKISSKTKISGKFRLKSILSKISTKIDIFRTFQPKSRFSQDLTQIEIFCKFRPKSKCFENLD